MYPLAMFDGKVKERDWSAQRKFPAQDSGSAEETAWVLPDKFVDLLPVVLEGCEADVR